MKKPDARLVKLTPREHRRGMLQTRLGALKSTQAALEKLISEKKSEDTSALQTRLVRVKATIEKITTTLG